jgi:VanZ family protein
MKVGRFVSNWVPGLVWMLFMFIGSTDVFSAEHTSRFLVPFLLWLEPQISAATIVSIHFALRKIGHLTEYAILAALLWRGLRGTFNTASKMVLALSTFLAAAAFAASDEYHQSFVPSRTASAHDVMIDCVGAFVTVLLCWILARRNPAYEGSIK